MFRGNQPDANLALAEQIRVCVAEVSSVILFIVTVSIKLSRYQFLHSYKEIFL